MITRCLKACEDENGFTMIELVVAMTLLTMLMLYIVPSLAQLASGVIVTGNSANSQLLAARSMDVFVKDIRQMDSLHHLRSGYNQARPGGGGQLGASIGFVLGRDDDRFKPGGTPETRLDFVCFRWVRPENAPGDPGYREGYVERLVLPFVPRPGDGVTWDFRDADGFGDCLHTNIASPETMTHDGQPLGEWQRMTGADLDVKEMVFTACHYAKNAETTTRYDCYENMPSVKADRDVLRRCSFQASSNVQYFRPGSKPGQGAAYRPEFNRQATISAAPRSIITMDRMKNAMHGQTTCYCLLNPGDSDCIIP